MSSRSDILKAIKQNKPPLSPLPKVEDYAENASKDLFSYFSEVLKLIGGQAIALEGAQQLDAQLKKIYPEHKQIASTVEGVSIANVDLHAIQDPHDLKDLDLAIIQGQFAVAENAAIWVDDTNLVHRSLGFITQHLVLVVPKGAIVWNMHQAYKKLEILKPGYGAFIAGPSKTADIEQSLVIGAHGARSLTVFFA